MAAAGRRFGASLNVSERPESVLRAIGTSIFTDLSAGFQDAGVLGRKVRRVRKAGPAVASPASVTGSNCAGRAMERAADESPRRRATHTCSRSRLRSCRSNPFRTHNRGSHRSSRLCRSNHPAQGRWADCGCSSPCWRLAFRTMLTTKPCRPRARRAVLNQSITWQTWKHFLLARIKGNRHRRKRHRVLYQIIQEQCKTRSGTPATMAAKWSVCGGARESARTSVGGVAVAADEVSGRSLWDGSVGGRSRCCPS
jgi:hypothetical protein